MYRGGQYYSKVGERDKRGCGVFFFFLRITPYIVWNKCIKYKCIITHSLYRYFSSSQTNPSLFSATFTRQCIFLHRFPLSDRGEDWIGDLLLFFFTYRVPFDYRSRRKTSPYIFS